MRQFKSILLYANETSSSEAALRRAEVLATSKEALICLVDVLPDSGAPWLMVEGQPELQQAVVTARGLQLGLLVAPAVRRGVDATAQVLIGKPGVEIIREVLRNRHDLVLLKAEASDGGAVQLALHLLKSCPCPVWVVKRDEPGPRRRILVAVDTGQGWWEQGESLRVLELAASVAESDGSELLIVDCMGHWTSGNSEKSLKHDSRRRLDQLLAKCDLGHVPYDVRVESEGVVNVVAALREEIDMVVLGTVWRGGPGGLLLADTAENVLGRVDCSVLAVKPRGFLSPVSLSEQELANFAA